MIKVGKQSLSLSISETQISPKGRPFRISMIKRGKESKWIGSQLKNDWIYTFKYLDGSGYFSFRFTYDNKFLEKL